MVGWKIDLCQKDGIYMARNLPKKCIHQLPNQSLNKRYLCVIKFFSSNKKVAQTFVPKHLPQQSWRRNDKSSQKATRGALLSRVIIDSFHQPLSSNGLSLGFALVTKSPTSQGTLSETGVTARGEISFLISNLKGQQVGGRWWIYL